MINKLRNKIFWILQISLTCMVLGVIILYLVVNYKASMDSIEDMLIRYSDNIGAKASSKKEGEEDDENEEKEGVYKLSIVNSEVIKNPNDADENIQSLAIKVSDSSNTVGIIKNYIYKSTKLEKDSYVVTIIQNDTMTSHVRNLFVISGVTSIFAIVIIFFISRKLSKIIAKPIEETFEKQKQFISDASHELKTPLSIIEINAEMAEKKLGENKWTTYIQNESESMNNLINDLLLLAKTGNMESTEKYEVFDLSKEVEIITTTFEIVAYDKGVRLNTDITENIKMNGSKEDIKHILSTLIDNAIKHTEKGNEVMIELSKEKSEIVLQVKNQGEPIPEEEKDKIFERFYRIDKSRNRNEKRYGLGLAIAKATVEKYNGKIEVICKDGITNFKVKI